MLYFKICYLNEYSTVSNKLDIIIIGFN